MSFPSLAKQGQKLCCGHDLNPFELAKAKQVRVAAYNIICRAIKRAGEEFIVVAVPANINGRGNLHELQLRVERRKEPGVQGSAFFINHPLDDFAVFLKDFDAA